MPIADFSLEGKVAIVTGGSRGIGRSISIGLAEHGADVAIAARKPDALAEAVEAVSATGRRGVAIPTNVRKIEELGHESLHQASTAALRAAAPYAPLPDDFPEENLVIILSLHYPAWK